MVPAVFTELAALPLTPNGKLDRAALPAPDHTRPAQAGQYTAPATPAEELLAEIFAQVLGLDRVSTEDNFFDLGGHSLLVTQAVARIRASGYEVSVGDFFDHPTIAAAAPLVRAQAEDPEIRSAVRIRGGTVAPAVFCVHPQGGTVTPFAELAGHLAEGQQFYGLQSRGLIDDAQPLESVEEMAVAYLKEVQHLQSDGPYLFAGWSMGGYVAVEMGRQMAMMGKAVAGVFLIGPPAHRPRTHTEQFRDWAAGRILSRGRKGINAGSGQQRRSAIKKRLLQILERGDDDPAGGNRRMRVGRVARTNAMAVTHYRALQRRRLRPYDGRVVLFMPRDDPAEMRRDCVDQWRSALLSEPEILEVPGHHETVVTNGGAETIGAWLSAEIARWQRPAGDRQTKGGRS
jgi:thioesterase domain-containing protein/aryl carrier-like protein